MNPDQQRALDRLIAKRQQRVREWLAAPRQASVEREPRERAILRAYPPPPARQPENTR